LNEKESTSPELAALSDAAASFMGSSSNAVVNDQIKILQSRRLIFKTIQRHHLNVQYFVKGKVNTTEIMDSDAFALATFINDTHYTEENFKGNLVLEAVSNDAFKVIESDNVKEGTYGYNTVITSEIGAFSVSANKKNQTKGTMVVKFSPVLDMVAKVKRKLNITPDVDKNSMIVDFNMIDHLKGRAELLINSLIGLYNEESKEDGTKLSVATSDFINERLKLIEGDLKNVDKDLADYKTANKLNNTEMESGAFLQNALTVDQEVVELNAQLQVAEHLIKTLTQNTAVLLPSNVGIQDPALTSAINSYNQLVLEKQEYSKSMREDNPAMITLNQNIANV